MMITKQQALTNNYFHMEPFPSTLKCKNWRRNGKTKTWKTRPNDFKVPIKHGLYDYAYIDQNNAQIFHLESECTNEKK